MKLRHPADRNERGRFERFAEGASNLTSSPAFYAVCVMLVALFLAAKLAGWSVEWQIFTADLMTAVTLMLLALLKNSERRAERAVQRKLDAIAAALLDQREGRQGRVGEDLENAIGMDEEV
ncbi:low affinity iron permease family protein [Yinghuangia seranimata]|uniref:low affinity iron permease family protein n=1 Tax=Yinghuangia seranimata TaxID=408067 RepID=UPI00248B22C2|nr:low affinity iron permease family protein [Yinghuangia seranimata]MDI2125406.1 low affinity iron permease family protein [Yinghuangia seranimata]